MKQAHPFFSPKPKHVLMVTSTLARGGTERQMLATAHGLVRLGYRIEILELARVPADQFDFGDELSRLGLTSRCATESVVTFEPGQEPTDVDDYGLGRFGPLIPHLSIANLAAALDQAIRDFRPEVVHGWSEAANVIGGLVAAKAGVPRIVLSQRNVTPRWWNAPQSELYRDAYRQILRASNVIVTNNSMANRDEYEKWLDLPGGTIKLIYNGFLPSGFRVRRGDEIRESRRSLGVPEGARTVGAVMRLAPEKDPELWLETAMAIARAREDTWFVLAGYGALADQVARKIQELGLADRFKLAGPTMDVGSIYAALDVFLMTSRFEGTPNALIEAQAAGVPVVAPLVGGTGETALHGTTGLLVNDRTAASLANAVLEILDDSSWRERSARHGPVFVADRFGHRRMIAETLALYGHSRASLHGRVLRVVGRLRSALR